MYAKILHISVTHASKIFQMMPIGGYIGGRKDCPDRNFTWSNGYAMNFTDFGEPLTENNCVAIEQCKKFQKTVP